MTSAPATGLLLALLTLQPVPVWAEIYRCQDGATLRFSDQPCGSDAVRLRLPPPNLVQAVPSAPLARQYDERVEAQVRGRAAEDAAWRERHEAARRSADGIRSARIRRDLVIGMSANDVRTVRGAPQQLRRDDSGPTPREIWVYAGKDQPRETLTLERGVVVDLRGDKGKGR